MYDLCLNLKSKLYKGSLLILTLLILNIQFNSRLIGSEHSLMHSIAIVAYVPWQDRFVLQANNMTFPSWKYSIENAASRTRKMDLLLFVHPDRISNISQDCRLIQPETFRQSHHRY